MDKVNQSFENEQIGLEEKNEKIILIQKIKNNKIAMIDYTKVLFQKILKEEPDFEIEKSERMDYLLHSINNDSPHLDSFYPYNISDPQRNHHLELHPLPHMEPINPQYSSIAEDVL